MLHTIEPMVAQKCASVWPNGTEVITASARDFGQTTADAATQWIPCAGITAFVVGAASLMNWTASAMLSRAPRQHR